MKMFEKVGFFMMLMLTLTSCGVKKDEIPSMDKGSERSDVLKILNSSECDEGLLDILETSYNEELEGSQLVLDDRIYRCCSVYKNTLEELLTEEEKKELFANKEYDLQAAPTSKEWYKVTIDDTDERYDSFKDNLKSVLLIYDNTGDKLLDSMIFDGAIDCRIKERDNTVYWEVSELKNVDIYYKNENGKDVVCYDGFSDNSIYEIQISKMGAEEMLHIVDEEEVSFNSHVKKSEDLEFLKSETRTLTMQEIVADNDLRKFANELANSDLPGVLSLNPNKYGYFYYSFLSGRVGLINLTCDGYVLCFVEKEAYYVKMTREEFYEEYKINKSGPIIYGDVGFASYNKAKPLFINGDVNPELFEELDKSK